jgi:hypothetical protein
LFRGAKRLQCQRREEDHGRLSLPRPWSPYRVWFCRRRAPFFRRGEGRVDEALLEVETAAVLQILSKGSQHPMKGAILLPTLKPAMARLVVRVFAWKVFPLRTGSENPKDSVPQSTWLGWMPARSVGALKWPLRQKRPDDFPLLIREVHQEFRSHPPAHVELRVEIRSNFNGLSRPTLRQLL